MIINKFGITFDHNGDDVMYIWPWMRLRNLSHKFISFGFDDTFRSLKEIDDLWVEYFEAQMRLSVEEFVLDGSD